MTIALFLFEPLELLLELLLRGRGRKNGSAEEETATWLVSRVDRYIVQIDPARPFVRRLHADGFGDAGEHLIIPRSQLLRRAEDGDREACVGERFDVHAKRDKAAGRQARLVVEADRAVVEGGDAVGDDFDAIGPLAPQGLAELVDGGAVGVAAELETRLGSRG